jgi:hypothetical protein
LFDYCDYTIISIIGDVKREDAPGPLFLPGQSTRDWIFLDTVSMPMRT